MTHPVILYDRSRVTTDWRCPRSRLLAYEWDGKGLASENIALELFTGTMLHDGLAAIAADVSIDAIADAARKQMKESLIESSGAEGSALADAEVWANEQAALTEGLLRGFYKHVWPQLRERFPTLEAVEKELIYKHQSEHFGGKRDLSFMSKPDLLPRDREGGLWYVEYKSTGSNKDTWTNSWSTAVQLHSAVRAVEAVYGEKVVGVLVQGLYKGYVNYGKQTSPFCYAYFRAGNPPFTKDAWSYGYAAGYKKFPVWVMDGGVRAWVDAMPSDILAEQFPQVPTIFVNDDLVDAFFRQRAERESEIAMAAKALRQPDLDADTRQKVLDMSFPQRFDQCRPSFGKACQFNQLCHGAPGRDPLEHGFVYRTPHHQPEVDAWAAKDQAHELPAA